MKLMIIDDESATRNGLLKHISWLSLGIEQIKVMGDAKRALEVCREWEPEIVLSDVRMPEMDGITLCRKLKELNEDCQIVFISGYADKEALLGAIGLGAVSFVEKPIDLQQLESAMRMAVQKSLERGRHFFNRKVLEQNIPLIEMEVVENLISGKITRETEKNLEMFHLRGGYQVILIQAAWEFESRASFGDCVITNLNEIFDGISYIKGYRGQREMICVLYGLEMDQFTENAELYCAVRGKLAALKAEGMELFLAIGKMVEEQKSIRVSFENALKALEKLFFYDYSGIAYTGNSSYICTRVLEVQLQENCVRALETYEFEKARDYLKKIYQDFCRNQSIGVQAVREYYFRLYCTLYQLERREENGALGHMEEIWKIICGQDTLRQLHENFCEKLEEKMHPVDIQNVASSTVFEIIRKVNQEYANENLNVVELAEAVFLTPAYISRIFKKEMEMTIGQYITEVRINAAKRYLKDKSLKLYQVAERCGYSDPNYFAKTFRRYTGLTPSEYRRRRE